MNSGIVILGSGTEVDYLIKNIQSHIPVLAYGYDKTTFNSAEETINYCQRASIPVITELSQLDRFDPRFVFMMSYPKLIGTELLKKYRFINVHGALVPRYRGMHGGTWALINGEQHHGYSVHEVDLGIDSGPVYHQGIIEANLSDNINDVRQKITDLFIREILGILTAIYNDLLKPEPQIESDAIYVSRRIPDDSRILWNCSSLQIHNLIRSLAPPYTNGAFCFYKEKKLNILQSTYGSRLDYIGIPGQVVAKFEGQGVLIKTGDNSLLINKLEVESIVYSADAYFKTVGSRLL